jgi:hypothetical protein
MLKLTYICESRTTSTHEPGVKLRKGILANIDLLIQNALQRTNGSFSQKMIASTVARGADRVQPQHIL